MLILPEGASLANGGNLTIIGNMTGGTSASISWSVLFQSNGSYTIEVKASGYDSNGVPCMVLESTQIPVVSELGSWTLVLIFILTSLLCTTYRRRKLGIRQHLR